MMAHQAGRPSATSNEAAPTVLEMMLDSEASCCNKCTVRLIGAGFLDAPEWCRYPRQALSSRLDRLEKCNSTFTCLAVRFRESCPGA